MRVFHGKHNRGGGMRILIPVKIIEIEAKEKRTVTNR
jgi:hypothetical protein